MTVSTNAPDAATARAPTPRAVRAFVGVSIAAFVVALAAVFAVPAWQQSNRTARARTTVSDLLRFEQAFQAYAHEHGDWPASAAPGTLPAGVERTWKDAAWEARTPIGGRYAWLADTEQRGQRLRAVIAIVSIKGDPVSDDQRQVEALLNAARAAKVQPNRLRLGFRGEPIYVLEN